MALLWVLAYQGYTLSIYGTGAPFIARDFSLDDGGIATLYAWVASAALGVLALSRMADRAGRRGLVVGCMAATPLAAVAAAMAPGLTVFAVSFVLLNAFIGAAVSGAVVMLAETLPGEARARGQGYGGVAAALGAGVGLIAMPILEQLDHSWRWLLGGAAMGLLTLPLVARAIPESRLWQNAAGRGETGSSRLLHLLGTPHRRRAVPLLVCAFLSVMAASSAETWSYYRAVSDVGLSVSAASALILASGALGLLGFPLGASACERFGRVPTVAAAWLAAGAGAFLFYWHPPPGLGPPSVLQLGVGFFGLVTGVNAALVGFRASSTELFPTALRGTVMGGSALMGALGLVAAQVTIALLAERVGGLSVVVRSIALLSVPSAILFVMFIDETRGLQLGADHAATAPVAGEVE